MNIQSIRFKYTAAFTAVALSMAIVAIVSLSLINTLTSYSGEFSQKFNPAISAVINANRDLYQARVAELNILLDAKTINSEKENYSENAQQALDRMNLYLDLLKDYPEISGKLTGFEKAYDAWLNESGKVFSLVQAGDVSKAALQSKSASLTSFSTLRDFYDIAGEAADLTGVKLGKEILTNVNSRSTFVLVLMIVTVSLALVAGVIAPKTLSLALVNLTRELRGLNGGDGDLTRRIYSKRKDEIGTLSDEVDELLNGLTGLIRGIVNGSTEVLSNVSDMKVGAGEVQSSSQQQMESVEVIVTSVNEMAAAIKEVAQNAQLTADEITQVNQLCNEGKSITSAAVDQVHLVSKTVGNASTVMNELAESSNNIASVLDVIRGIAEQTNLLALNAAIEAARAGEQGRGFAVVADEVRSLASKTQQSTDDIQTMIEVLQKGVKEAVEAIEGGIDSVNASVEKSQSTMASLDDIVAAATRVSDASILIATSTEEQSKVAEDVNDNLVKLSELGKVSLEHSSANRDRSVKVTQVTTELNNSVSHFNLGS